MKKGGFELGVKSSVMIKEIDGLQYLYTKDAKAVVTEEKKKNAMSICDIVRRLPMQRQNF